MVAGSLQGYKRSVTYPSTANVPGIDKRLMDIIRKAADNSPYSVSVTPSGGAVRGKRSPTSQHVKGKAVDIQLYDGNGRAIPNYHNARNNPAAFKAYQDFANIARTVQMQDYPELNSKLRWGGYFGGTTAKYGAFDLMHFDLAGTAMAGGSWATGLTPEMASYWGVSNSPSVSDVAYAFSQQPASGPTPPADVGFGARTIRPGYKGEDVKALQTALIGMGAKIPDGPTGYYGDQTRAAVQAFQKANGLSPDGVVGKDTHGMLRAAAYDSTTLEARDAAAAARQAAIKMPSRVSTPESLRLNGLAEEYARRQVAPLQGAPTIPVERRALPDIQRPLASPADNNAPPGIGTPAIDMANRRRMTPNQMVDAVEGAAVRRMQAQATRPVASAADNNAPPGIGPSLISGAPRITATPQQEADAKQRLAAELRAMNPVQQPARPISRTPASAYGGAPRITGTPDQQAEATRRLTAELGAMRGPLASSADNRAPPGIGFETPTQSDERIARNGLTPSAVMASYARQAPQRTLASAADNNAPPGIGRAPMASAAASARPDPRAVSRAFDIMSNYQAAPQRPASPASAAIAPSLPSRNVPTLRVAPPSSAPVGVSTPGSMAPGYPKPAQALSPAQAAIAARYSGLAAQYAAKPPAPAPAYTATSPVAPPVPKPNPLGAPQMPGVAAATAVPGPQPPSALKALGPGMLGMAMATSPLGMLGGFARLAAASLGNVNNPKGLGFSSATLANNNRYTPAASDMIGGNNGSASYGRKTSDGVRGTTSSGTRYTSRDNGRQIDVGGRSYTKKDSGGYSMNVGRR